MGKHYIPQKYLQGFSLPNDTTQVWQYDKRQRSWSQAAIKRVAQQRDYYTVDIEKRLAAEIETPANIVIDCLRARNALTGTDRDALIVYIAVMMMRVPRKRRKGFEQVPSVLQSIVSQVREELIAIAPSVNPERLPGLLEELAQIEREYQARFPDNVVQQIQSPWPSENVVNELRKMTWRIIPAPPEAFFLTTDNPAFFFDVYGVGTPKAELVFPLAHDLALHGSHSHQDAKGATLLVQPKMALVKEINRRVTSGAERFIFSRYRERWIETVADKPNPYLRRIVW